jgi:hypothetical protein
VENYLKGKPPRGIISTRERASQRAFSYGENLYGEYDASGTLEEKYPSTMVKKMW